MKQKAARNKTIDFTLEEGHVYLERCILAENGDQLKTVLQDGSTMTRMRFMINILLEIHFR